MLETFRSTQPSADIKDALPFNSTIQSQKDHEELSSRSSFQPTLYSKPPLPATVSRVCIAFLLTSGIILLRCSLDRNTTSWPSLLQFPVCVYLSLFAPLLSLLASDFTNMLSFLHLMLGLRRINITYPAMDPARAAPAAYRVRSITVSTGYRGGAVLAQCLPSYMDGAVEE